MSFLLSTEFVPASMIALHGQDAVGIVVAEGGEWADGVDEVSDIEAFELAGPSYTRIEGTFGVERIGDEWLLFVEGAVAVDTSDSDDRVGVWLATDDGTLVGYQDDPGTGSGSYLPAWPDGVYALPITPSSTSTGVQSVTGAGVDNTDPSAPVIEHIPVPAGSTLGQVWTSNGPAVPASWQDPSGGGAGGEPDLPESWASPTGTVYLDRDRVWFAGAVMASAAGDDDTIALSDIPSGMEPGTSRQLMTFGNDATDGQVVVALAVSSGGAVTAVRTDGSNWSTGTAVVLVEGLSYRLADPE